MFIGPDQFTLHSAFPNPFNGAVNFSFMPENESVTFKIFDLNGRVVTEKLILPGIKGEYSLIGMVRICMVIINQVEFISISLFQNPLYQDKITYLK